MQLVLENAHHHLKRSPCLGDYIVVECNVCNNNDTFLSIQSILKKKYYIKMTYPNKLRNTPETHDTADTSDYVLLETDTAFMSLKNYWILLSRYLP